jgi:hypothetical protein
MMPPSLPQLYTRKEQICNEISTIKTMRRGSLTEWSYNRPLKDGTLKERGPFYKLTRKDENNKTVGIAVPKAELDYYKQEVANYQQFRSLTDEYAEVCEQISAITHIDDEAKKN